MNTNKFPIKRIYFLVVSGKEKLQNFDTSAVICVSGEVKINGAEIKKDEVGFLLPASRDNINSIHYEAESDGGSLLITELDNEFILDNSKSLFEFEKLPFTSHKDNALYFSVLDSAKDYFKNNRSYTLDSSLAFLILDRLTRLMGNPTYALDESVLSEVGGAVNHLFRQIFDYMHENIFDSVSLNEAANKTNRTPQYISKLFKQYAGATFLDYFAAMRHDKQKAYRKYTDLGFFKIKKKFFSESHCADNSDSYIPFGDDFDYDSFDDFGDLGESDDTANIIFDDNEDFYCADNDCEMTAVELNKLIDMLSFQTDGRECTELTVDEKSEKNSELFPVWNEVVNLGYASAFTSTDLNEQLLRAQKLIHFRYGRICRIFDLVTTYFSHDEPIYDFYPVFRIFDALIANDMLPFLELGNKVLKIHFTAEELLKPQIAQKSDDYFEEILLILPHFLRASINRYGYECVKNWKFELCSPNHEAPINTVEDFPLQKYIHYFCRIKSTINSIVPECQVGGPGFNNHDNPESFERLLREFSFASVQPDFYTAYIFTVDNPLHISTLSADPDIFEKRIKQLTEAIGKVCPNRDLYITEFNSNLSSRTYLNDSAYQGAFIVKTVFACMRMGVKGLGYYMLSDLPLRYSDTNDMLFGGWGLITDTDLPKPSFHAYHMLSMLGSRLSLLTDNCIITNSKPNSYQCLIYNYENVTPDFRVKNIDKLILCDNCGEVFERENNTLYKHYTINFPNLRQGVYTVKIYRTNNDSANLLHTWYRFDFLNPQKIEDFDIFGEMSKLEPIIYSDDAVIGLPLSVSADLSGEEVLLITIDLFRATDQ